jgi:thioredoxin reductase
MLTVQHKLETGHDMTDNRSDVPEQLDVVVVGGGPAGLQAALTLGRMRRRVLLLDSGDYRNAATRHMHNFISHDGDEPERLRAAAREGITRYDTVELRSATVTDIEAHGDGWLVGLDGDEGVCTRKVILATGLRDQLPDKPGLAELWGDVVAHCPYCHGHEFRGRHVAILGAGPHVPRLAMLLSRITSRITVLTDGAEIDEATLRHLQKAGVDVRSEAVTGVCRSSTGATVELASGAKEDVGGLFVSPELSQAAPFAEKLGLEMLPSGCVRIDEFGRSSRPGIYAAGDMAHLSSLPMPLASVLNAAAAGLLSGTAADQDLVVEDHAWVMPV